MRGITNVNDTQKKTTRKNRFDNSYFTWKKKFLELTLERDR